MGSFLQEFLKSQNKPVAELRTELIIADVRIPCFEHKSIISECVLFRTIFYASNFVDKMQQSTEVSQCFLSSHRYVKYLFTC